jgi:hypothetical protein
MLICGNVSRLHVASKVVSTKLTEEEYGKLVGLCSTSGFTVSKLLKRAILARMNEDRTQIEKPPQTFRDDTPKPSESKKTLVKASNTDDRFLYY